MILIEAKGDIFRWGLSHALVSGHRLAWHYTQISTHLIWSYTSRATATKTTPYVSTSSPSHPHRRCFLPLVRQQIFDLRYNPSHSPSSASSSPLQFLPRMKVLVVVQIPHPFFPSRTRSTWSNWCYRPPPRSSSTCDTRCARREGGVFSIKAGRRQRVKQGRRVHEMHCRP